jgi:hypothetical protein
MSARSGESWSTGGEGKNMTPTDLLCHIPKSNLVDTIGPLFVVVDCRWRKSNEVSQPREVNIGLCPLVCRLVAN